MRQSGDWAIRRAASRIFSGLTWQISAQRSTVYGSSDLTNPSKFVTRAEMKSLFSRSLVEDRTNHAQQQVRFGAVLVNRRLLSVFASFVTRPFATIRFTPIVFLIFKKISLNTFLKLLAMALILLSLFQPWWVLNASSDNPIAEKNTNMFIVPQAMIDRTTYNDKPYLELATIPELFTNFLGVLFLIVCSGFVLVRP